MRVRHLAVLAAAALALVLGTAAARAGDGPRLELVDHGDAVEIVAHGAIAAAAAPVAVVRERVEIALSNRPSSMRRLVEDPTALLLELRGDQPRVLSVKLRHDHDRVVALAGAVSYTQVGDALHVLIPRRVAAPPPEAAAIAPAAATAPAVTPPAAPGAPPATAAPTTATPAPAAALPRALAPAAPSAPAGPAAIAGGGSSRATGTRWWMVLAGLVLVGGGGVVLARRKRAIAVPENQLELIASRSLGGKARVVWMAAGDHELVIAVSPQQIRALATWPRTTPPTPRSFGRALDDARATDDTRAELPAEPPPRATTARPSEPVLARGSVPIPRLAALASPAISGLLRLRDRGAAPPPPMTDDDLDEDPRWTRELTSPSGGRR